MGDVKRERTRDADDSCAFVDADAVGTVVEEAIEGSLHQWSISQFGIALYHCHVGQF